MEQSRGLLTENLSLSHTSIFSESCKKFVSGILNKSMVLNEQQIPLKSIVQFLSKHNVTLDSFNTVPECITIFTRLINYTNESNTTILSNLIFYPTKYSKSLIIFVTIIAFVSIISIIGNLCLAKVLYSKRHRLMQTDRIVLCLAISELCLVLIDSPTEIYRFLSPSFTQEWLCRSHTFFEALLSSCIIFYHLLGAFDRFVYIHGHISSRRSFWSKWCRRISTKTGSITLLILPIICSLPIAICNFLHAHIFHASSTNKVCIVQYKHGILTGLLISFYILPLLLSFFLHGKLIYFIRTRHNQHYLTSTPYLLPMKRNNTIEFQSKRRSNKEHLHQQDRLLVQPKRSAHRRIIMTHTEVLRSTITTTTTMTAGQAVPQANPNNSSNSSQSSRSSAGTSSTSITSPIVLYKINSQANANANRTVLLLVLLLSFYVFCWAPYNIYTWFHVYFLTQSSSSSSNRQINNFTSFNDSTPKPFMSLTNNRNADLRRIIYINYCLYLLSMISMCFSFIFYFSLNKQARHEFTSFIGCICPHIIQIRNKKSRPNYPKELRQLPYHTRFPNQYLYKNNRMKNSSPSLVDDRYNHLQQMNNFQNDASKRRIVNYGCQIQCCP